MFVVLLKRVLMKVVDIKRTFDLVLQTLKQLTASCIH